MSAGSYQLALQVSPVKTQSQGRCGACSSTLGRRLDLLEGKTLSNWHEFLVHKSEMERKMEELFSSYRSPARPKSAAAAHLAELEQRIGQFERNSKQVEVTCCTSTRSLQDLQQTVDEFQKEVKQNQARSRQDSAEAKKALADLQQSVLSLQDKTGSLQEWLDHSTLEFRREIMQAFDRRCCQWQEEALQLAERAKFQAIGTAEATAAHALSSALSEISSSVTSALKKSHQSLEFAEMVEAVTERQCRFAESELGSSLEALGQEMNQRVRRLHTEVSTAEASIEEIQRSSHSFARAARAAEASEAVLRQRLNEVQAQSSTSLISLETCLETRAQQSRAEMYQTLRAFEADFEKRFALGKIEVLEARLESFIRRDVTNTLDASQIRRECSSRVDLLETKLATDLVAFKEEMKSGLSQTEMLTRRISEAQTASNASLQDEISQGLASSRDRLTSLAITTDALRENVLGLKQDITDIIKAHAGMESSLKRLTSAQGGMASELQALRLTNSKVALLDSPFDTSGAARAEAASLRSSVETCLHSLQTIRQVKQDLSEMKRVQEELQREQHHLRLEVTDHVQRVAHLERSAREVVRGEEASNQRVAALSTEVAQLARGSSLSIEARSIECTTKVEANTVRIEDLSLKVAQLSRELQRGSERAETFLRRVQEEAERRITAALKLLAGSSSLHQVRDLPGSPVPASFFRSRPSSARGS
jgi:chromosome segregation ATPase